MGRLVEIPGVSNVAAGATFTVELPVRRTYNKVALELGNITAAQLTNLVVEINGKPIWSLADLVELQAINDFYGRDDDSANGIYWLYFERPELKEPQRKLTVLGTLDVDTFTIRGELDGAVLSPTIKCHADFDAGTKLGLITKIKSFPVSYSTSGQHEIDKLPRGPRIMAMHLKKADIADVEVEADGVKVYDASKTLGESMQKSNARVPQTASYTHVDLLTDDDVMQALVTASLQDFRIRMGLTTSGSVRPTVEYLDQFAGI